jgi:MarR family transcriptional regulator for hemolysin
MTSRTSPRRELGFLLSDAARALRTLVDQRAREVGMTRAQWSVLVRVQRSEGLKQSDLAAQIDIAPITLARMIDRLGASGLVERRADPNDRRANRLYLTQAALPVLEKLATIGEAVMAEALDGLDDAALHALSVGLLHIKTNVKTCNKASTKRDGHGDDDE